MRVITHTCHNWANKQTKSIGNEQQVYRKLKPRTNKHNEVKIVNKHEGLSPFVCVLEQ